MAERREMTEELRRELAGHMSFSSEATVEFPPSAYLKHKQKPNEATGEFEDLPEFEIAEDLHGYFPTFVLRSFTKAENDKAERLICELRAEGAKSRTYDLNPKIRELARAATTDWRDFYDPAKKDFVAYKADPQGGCDREIFRLVTDGRVSEIFYYILRMSGIFPGEKLSLR